MKQSAILITLAVLFSSQAFAQSELAGRHQFILQGMLHDGTPVVATVVADGPAAASAEAAARQAIDRAIAFDSALFLPGGIQDQINALGTGRSINLPPDAYRLIAKAKDLAATTGGWFDITWPSKKALFTKRDWRRIVLEPESGSMSFKSDGMKVDLSRISKGYIVDLMLTEMARAGFPNAMANAGLVQRNVGRDIYTPWYIDIQYEGSAEGKWARRAQRFALTDTGVATATPSFMGAGMVDARNRKPVPAHLQSATVMAGDATIATAYAIAAYTIGPKFGMKYIKSHPETKGVIVDNQGSIEVSKGLVKETSHEITPTVQFNGGPNDLRQKQREEEQDR